MITSPISSPVFSPVFSPVGSVFGYLAAWSPSELFASGAQGAWYDPSDYSTLYQDAAGTTPVTAVEQPVRLMLDRSKGLVLGSELVTNGGFDSDITGWTNSAPASGDISFNSGEILISRVSGGVSAYQAITCVIGRFYKIEFEFASVSSGLVRINVTNTTTVPGSSLTNNNSGPVIFVATAVTMYVHLSLNSGNGTSGRYDNISVRELPGNHAVAPNDASRPILRARYNLLERSQEINSSPWANASTAANTTIAPDGTLTGDTITFSGSGTRSQDGNATITAGSVFTFSIWLKAGTATSLRIGIARSGAGTYEQTLSPILTVTSEWQRFSVSHTYANAQTGWRVTINGTDGTLDVWGASLLTAADQAATGGAYQRVGAATDYDTGPPWRPYLAFDGSDDSMSTSSIDFSGTDKMTVFAGVSKLSDAALAALTELSASSAGSAGNSGAFAFFAPNPSNLYTWRSKGTTLQDVNTNDSTYSAPDTSVLTGIGDISGDVSTLRIDGVQVGTNTNDQGTGNYGNYPLFIGRRNNASLPFNGRLYGLTVLGRTATAPELTAMESWIAGKTGVSLS